MKNKKHPLKFIPYNKYIFIIITLVLSITIFQIMYKTSPIFATRYSDIIYPYFVKIIGGLCSFVPFSVFEFIIILSIILILFSIGRLIYLLIKFHSTQNRFLFFYRLKKSILNFVCVFLSFYLVYSLTCGVNYYRLSFSACSYINTGEYTNEDLVSLAHILIDNTNDLSDKIEHDSNGYFILSENDLQSTSIAAMYNLSISYPSLTEYYPNAKPIFFSEVMSYLQIAGIYSPFTAEANYNNDIPDSEKPYVICHELSHLSGFMLEDEANFISYLACINSSSYDFQYSGSLNVLVPVLNNLYASCDSDTYSSIISEIAPQVISDLSHQNTFWAQYETPIASVSSEVNNSYLQSNGQTDGVQSYGRVTDLLLAYYDSDFIQ